MSWKKDTVQDLIDLIKSGDTLAVIDIHGVPAGAMLGMRATLRGDMKIQVAKKRLMSIAWERCGLKDENLNELFQGAVQPALVSSSGLNSFKLFDELKKTEAGRAAKEGDVAPHQIVVEKMDTGMPPGPIVGELNSVGIPAKIMGGSVQIQKRTVVLEEGDVFEGDMGMMLSKIGINPIVTVYDCAVLLKTALSSPQALLILTTSNSRLTSLATLLVHSISLATLLGIPTKQCQQFLQRPAERQWPLHWRLQSQLQTPCHISLDEHTTALWPLLDSLTATHSMKNLPTCWAQQHPLPQPLQVLLKALLRHQLKPKKRKKRKKRKASADLEIYSVELNNEVKKYGIRIRCYATARC